ncbi:MAG: RES family NAD+ phosphorylase, partial [Candidatus Omnitrophica bacterium]|nr:RES family NAD+ phosphorylase [Candidatus Omnitrophota bacterium]
MEVFRVAREAYKTDLSGTGARINGGRWNSPGKAVLYTSENRSLAILETLVHITSRTVTS